VVNNQAGVRVVKGRNIVIRLLDHLASARALVLEKWVGDKLLDKQDGVVVVDMDMNVSVVKKDKVMVAYSRKNYWCNLGLLKNI